MHYSYPKNKSQGKCDHDINDSSTDQSRHYTCVVIIESAHSDFLHCLDLLHIVTYLNTVTCVVISVSITHWVNQISLILSFCFGVIAS